MNKYIELYNDFLKLEDKYGEEVVIELLISMKDDVIVLMEQFKKMTNEFTDDEKKTINDMFDKINIKI